MSADQQVSPDEPIKPVALRSIAALERRASHPYSAQLIDMAADEIERLRALLADLLNDCDNWGCAPSDRYAEALRGAQ